jgi:hypothetical protein
MFDVAGSVVFRRAGLNMDGWKGGGGNLTLNILVRGDIDRCILAFITGHGKGT